MAAPSSGPFGHLWRQTHQEVLLVLLPVSPACVRSPFLPTHPPGTGAAFEKSGDDLTFPYGLLPGCLRGFVFFFKV